MATSQNLHHSWQLQRRVIGALIMRETITRYGRNNIGFLWLFVEPLLMTLLIVVVWSAIKASNFSNLNIAAFMVTGYPLAVMWRNSASRCLNAVDANTSLLFHRNVRVLDVFIARIILEVAGSTGAFCCIMLIFIGIGWIPMPDNPLYMTLAWLLMVWFAVGLGLILGVLSEHFEIFAQFWKSISFFLFPLSGALYLVDALPQAAQKIVLWIPMVHGTEMLRHGYFGTQIHTHENPWYLILSNIVLLFVGMLLVQRYSKGVEPS